MDKRMSAPIAPAQNKTKRFHFFILLAATVLLWFLLHGMGSDPDGLNYALNMETGDPVLFLGADHLLWHILVWLAWAFVKLFDPSIHPVVIQQLVNLLLFGGAIFLFYRYLTLKNRWTIWAGLGLVASFASLRAMSGEHVDSGSILATMILLHILPGSPRQPRLWLQILLLALLPWFHKSLIAFYPGYFLAYLFMAEDKLHRRIIKPLLTATAALLVSIIGFGIVWWLLISSHIPFPNWVMSYVGKQTGFWANSISAVIVGIPISLYRIFLSLTPYKAWQMGSPIGLAGLGISILAIVGLALLSMKSIWKGKTDSSASKNIGSFAIILAILPSAIFFCFWMPGMYYFWSRFLPAFWIVLALRMSETSFNRISAWCTVTMLMFVNSISLFSAKDGEEAGRLTKWVEQTAAKGDLIFIDGEGSLFDGKLLSYHLGVDVITLEYLNRREDASTWLKSQLEQAQAAGKHIWLVLDEGRFSSNRIISGESTAGQKGLELLQTHCTVSEKKPFSDPAFKDAGIAECSIRQ